MGGAAGAVGVAGPDPSGAGGIQQLNVDDDVASTPGGPLCHNRERGPYPLTAGPCVPQILTMFNLRSAPFSCAVYRSRQM